MLDNKGDIIAFHSLDDALHYAEAVDVEALEYDAFDSEGRLLTLALEKGGRYGNKRVIIAAVEESPGHQAELRRRLAHYLSRTGATVAPRAALGHLVKALAARTVHAK